MSELAHVCQPVGDGLPCAHPECKQSAAYGGKAWEVVCWGSKRDGTPGVVVVYLRARTNGRWHWMRDHSRVMPEGAGQR